LASGGSRTVLQEILKNSYVIEFKEFKYFSKYHISYLKYLIPNTFIDFNIYENVQHVETTVSVRV